jgi:hypothetical protein
MDDLEDFELVTYPKTLAIRRGVFGESGGALLADRL